MAVLEKKVSKYVEVSNRLREGILKGRFRSGDKLPTEKELAKTFGVSVTSVRGALRKLSDGGYISTIRGSGSYVDKPKQVLNSPNLNAIAIYTDIRKELGLRYLATLQGITQMAQTYGLRLEIVHPPINEKAIPRDKNLINLIESGQIGGLILYPSETLTWDDFYFLERSGIPFVICDMCHETKGKGLISWQRGNWFDQMIESMISRGYQKIAVVVGRLNKPGDFSIRSGQHIIAAYKRIMKESFIPLDPSYMMLADWSAESGYVAGKKLLSLPDPPQVICGANDLNAIGIIKAALDMGLEVPKDLKVWGRCDFLHPSFLSSVSEDLEKRGRHAVSALIQVVEGDIPDQEPECCQLVFRASTSEEENGDLIRSWVDGYFAQHPLDKKLLEEMEDKVQSIDAN